MNLSFKLLPSDSTLKRNFAVLGFADFPVEILNKKLASREGLNGFILFIISYFIFRINAQLMDMLLFLRSADISSSFFMPVKFNIFDLIDVRKLWSMHHR